MKCFKSINMESMYPEETLSGGKEHVHSANKKVSAKQVKTLKNRTTSCKYKCANKVTPAEREKCFTQFYQLNQDRKYD